MYSRECSVNWFNAIPHDFNTGWRMPAVKGRQRHVAVSEPHYDLRTDDTHAVLSTRSFLNGVFCGDTGRLGNDKTRINQEGSNSTRTIGTIRNNIIHTQWKRHREQLLEEYNGAHTWISRDRPSFRRLDARGAKIRRRSADKCSFYNKMQKGL